jgi:hypothetical protein
MSELTKEDFEQALKGLATKDDLLKAVAPLATKKDLEEQTEALARIVADTVANPFTKRFDDLEEKLDYSERIRMIENRLAKLEDEKSGGKFHLRGLGRSKA